MRYETVRLHCLPPSLFLVLPHSVTWHRGRGLRLSFSSPTSPTFLQSQPEQASSRVVYASGPTLSIWSVRLSYVHKHTLALSVETNMIINNTSYSYRINMPTHTSTRVKSTDEIACCISILWQLETMTCLHAIWTQCHQSLLITTILHYIDIQAYLVCSGCISVPSAGSHRVS